MTDGELRLAFAALKELPTKAIHERLETYIRERTRNMTHRQEAKMRTIDYAVLKQSIQRTTENHPLRSRETKTGLIVADEFFEEQGRREVAELLAKYITFADENHSYWIDRYWYFDVEKYQSDLSNFGIKIRMAVKVPTTITEHNK